MLCARIFASVNIKKIFLAKIDFRNMYAAKTINNPNGDYMFKVSNRNTRADYETCSS